MATRSCRDRPVEIMAGALFMGCAFGHVVQGWMDGCGASIAPGASAPVSELFSCMQSHGGGNPGPRTNEACAATHWSFQFVSCHGVAPDPNKGTSSGDSGGCRSATAPGGLAGILLFTGLFWFLRRRVLV